MDAIVARLEKIKKAVFVLKKQNTDLNLNNKKVEKELERLKQLVVIQNNSIKELEQKVKIKEIAEGFILDDKLEVNKRRALKQKINEMIKEVDKAITAISE